MKAQLNPGYTPENLRTVLRAAGVTRQRAVELINREIAEICPERCITKRTIDRWCTSITKKDGTLAKESATMPALHWWALTKQLGINEQTQDYEV